MTKSFTSSLGRSDLSVKGQGFIYAVNPRFNQASVGLEMLQAFSQDTKVRLRYYTMPDMLLGDNEERRSGTLSLKEERLTSHIGSVRLEQRLSEDWEVRILGRVGARLYNDAFAQRDTTFWTVGPHVVWRLVEGVKVLLGYHFERGLAEGRKQPQFKDDVSYINHYATAGVEAELTERLSFETGVHFERNNWTSGIAGDKRNGGHESVFQGEVTFLYRLTEQTGLTLGFQRSHRRQSFEQEIAHNTNVNVGANYRF